MSTAQHRSVPGPLHPSILTNLRVLLGEVPPASDRTVIDLATTVAQRRDHDHTQRACGEDLFCSNLAGWSGERIGYLLSRLIVEGERTEGRRTRLVAMDNDALNIRGLLAPADGPRLVPMELGETLLPAVQWLVEQLAATPRLAYRAEIHTMTLGTYTTRAVAEQHCEADLNANVDLEGRRISWIPEHGGDDAVSELAVFDSAGDDEATGYMITPIELQTAYNPNAEC